MGRGWGGGLEKGVSVRFQFSLDKSTWFCHIRSVVKAGIPELVQPVNQASLEWSLSFEATTGILHVHTSGTITRDSLPGLFGDTVEGLRRYHAHRLLVDNRDASLALSQEDILRGAQMARSVTPDPTTKLAIVFSHLGPMEQLIRQSLFLFNLRVAIFDRLEIAISWLTDKT